MLLSVCLCVYAGDEEVLGVNQTNKTEEDNPKKWVAVSILDYTFIKAHNVKPLRCVAVHEAYPTKSRDTQVFLDIQSPFKYHFSSSATAYYSSTAASESQTAQTLSHFSVTQRLCHRKGVKRKKFKIQLYINLICISFPERIFSYSMDFELNIKIWILPYYLGTSIHTQACDPIQRH
ncbi:unnamed protein product [Allacma fusca]|uniref:Uncharacterized protein n=1 Tax=Allacma fusca TaxID=39272 RepID=A0A8J2L7U4_9HEXA|nr:unnamed protein product [Allacma fusca]